MDLSINDASILDQVLQSGQEEHAEKVIISEQELGAIRLAEQGKFAEALDMLDRLVQKDTSNPSLLNNRAQVLRLLYREAEAVADLTRAIELAEDDAITCRQACAQQAWIALKLDGEEAARPFFERAASLGCKASKRMANRCNPYSAMCNQMLRSALKWENNIKY